jgi:hypothetical protein
MAQPGLSSRFVSYVEHLNAVLSDVRYFLCRRVLKLYMRVLDSSSISDSQNIDIDAIILQLVLHLGMSDPILALRDSSGGVLNDNSKYIRSHLPAAADSPERYLAMGMDATYLARLCCFIKCRYGVLIRLCGF